MTAGSQPPPVLSGEAAQGWFLVATVRMRSAMAPRDVRVKRRRPELTSRTVWHALVVLADLKRPAPSCAILPSCQ